jgi:hypothetical protein
MSSLTKPKFCASTASAPPLSHYFSTTASSCLAIFTLGLPVRSCSFEVAHFALQSYLISLRSFEGSSLFELDPTGGGRVLEYMHLDMHSSNDLDDLEVSSSSARALDTCIILVDVCMIGRLGVLNRVDANKDDPIRVD